MGLAVVLAAIVALAGVREVSSSEGSAPPPPRAGLRVENGWFVHDGRLVWGIAQHNGWWRAGQRPNLTRRAPGEVRPNRTEDLDLLTDNMLRYGHPGFEHNFGLWYDRRRDRHDTARRTDGNVVPPFLEQPWARSDVPGAWDGLAKYDLERFNDWYFERLEKFAELCDRKGTVLVHNYYMQHVLLETNAHYVDFAWRPVNCVQKTELPDHTPAANAFYDVSQPERRRLHRAYVRHCLDVLGRHTNVVHLPSLEYTGPAAFVRFWLDTVAEWEAEHGRDVIVGLGATRDVFDELAADPRVAVLDLRYWWYRADGTLHAPPGGREVPGRYMAGGEAAKTTPWQIHRQVREVRERYPHKAILHAFEASSEQAWAFLMGGGSLLVRRLEEPEGKDPAHYGVPSASRPFQPTYDWLRREMAARLPNMAPRSLVLDERERNWCLASDRTVLVYALEGGRFRLDLQALPGTFRARWFDPQSGAVRPAAGGTITGGRVVELAAPDTRGHALWLVRE